LLDLSREHFFIVVIIATSFDLLSLIFRLIMLLRRA